jgi:tRNA-2-methylthio-N6-dimethylallyladenosine synthase
MLESLGFEHLDIDEKDFKNERGFLTEILSQTDLFIVNTCSVRQKSEDKVYGLGKVIKEDHNEEGNKPFIVLAGCMVGSVTGERQRDRFAELKKRTSWADAYMNPSQIFDLPSILRQYNVLSDWAIKKYDSGGVKPRYEGSKHAFVNISSGCDNFCTFCVVPYARGREVSRSKGEIMGEINHLVRRGVTKVTLCGQNVNSWGLNRSKKFKLRSGSRHKLPFAQLLKDVHDIDYIVKIDFISSNPFDFTQDLINALRLPKISNYLHIAVQSGNNDVLKRMNRRHTVEEFIDLINRIKKARPDVELGTDAIVGFPGETREQFMDTVKLFRAIPFKVAYIAMYSPRKGTQAEKFYEDDVDLDEKKWRHEYLTNVWRESRKDE